MTKVKNLADHKDFKQEKEKEDYTIEGFVRLPFEIENGKGARKKKNIYLCIHRIYKIEELDDGNVKITDDYEEEYYPNMTMDDLAYELEAPIDIDFEADDSEENENEQQNP